MADTKVKDRSPSFPFIPLKSALERSGEFEAKFGRHPIPASKVGLAWGMKEKSSQAFQVLAALKAFGLVEYEGSAASRMAQLTEDARMFLRAQQDSVKRDVAKRLALNPKLMGEFWELWGAKRPPDEVCLDHLILKRAFTDSAARNFLKVYDATVEFAGLSDDPLVTSPVEGRHEQAVVDSWSLDPKLGAVGSLARGDRYRPAPIAHRSDDFEQADSFQSAPGERILTTGLLSKSASFRLFVSGRVGKTEIERLIKKLELDKEILADDESREIEEVIATTKGKNVFD